MPEREVSTTEDGVRIAYSVEGAGPALIALPTFFESFSHEHLSPLGEPVPLPELDEIDGGNGGQVKPMAERL